MGMLEFLATLFLSFLPPPFFGLLSARLDAGSLWVGPARNTSRRRTVCSGSVRVASRSSGLADLPLACAGNWYPICMLPRGMNGCVRHAIFNGVPLLRRALVRQKRAFSGPRGGSALLRVPHSVT